TPYSSPLHADLRRSGGSSPWSSSHSGRSRTLTVSGAPTQAPCRLCLANALEVRHCRYDSRHLGCEHDGTPRRCQVLQSRVALLVQWWGSEKWRKPTPLLGLIFQHETLCGQLSSASSTLNFGVQSLQFRSGVVDFELPVD